MEQDHQKKLNQTLAVAFMLELTLIIAILVYIFLTWVLLELAMLLFKR